MTKSELESMHISELHALAAEAGVERFRMLRREDLVERLLEHAVEFLVVDIAHYGSSRIPARLDPGWQPLGRLSRPPTCSQKKSG